MLQKHQSLSPAPGQGRWKQLLPFRGQKCLGEAHHTCPLADRGRPQDGDPSEGAATPGSGDSPGCGRSPWAGGVGAGPPDKEGCDLPKVPEPLDGQGPHAAPGAAAVLVGAASVERGRGLVSVESS